MSYEGRKILLTAPGKFPSRVDFLQIFSERSVKLLQNEDLIVPVLPSFVPGRPSQCDCDAHHDEGNLADRIAPIWS
jgi:hypothetical protein